MGVYGVTRLGSIHNNYNVPSEPERAAKARRAVVASTEINRESASPLILGKKSYEHFRNS